MGQFNSKQLPPSSDTENMPDPVDLEADHTPDCRNCALHPSKLEKTSIRNADKFFEIKDVHAKGKGVFAIRNIPEGTVILTEKRLLEIKGPDERAQVLAWFEELSPRDQAAYLNLKGCFPYKNVDNTAHSNYQVWSIWDTNMWEHSNDEGGCVYEIGSRFNHSCANNVETFVKGESSEHVYETLRDIKAGEELTVTYIPDQNHLPCGQRRKILMEGWKFHRRCEACVAESVGPET